MQDLNVGESRIWDYGRWVLAEHLSEGGNGLKGAIYRFPYVLRVGVLDTSRSVWSVKQACLFVVVIVLDADVIAIVSFSQAI